MTMYDACGQPIDGETRARWRRNGARLRTFREAAGVSLAELAEVHGVNACDWQLAEMGARDLSAAELVDALPALGVSANDVLGGWS